MAGVMPEFQADTYIFFERVTKLPAGELLDRVDFGSKDLNIFDNASGAGLVPHLLHERGILDGNVKLLAGDISVSMIEFAKSRCESEGWKNTDAQVIDAQV